jgi:hypothetical protein
MDAGSRRIVRVIRGDFDSEAGSNSGLIFQLQVGMPEKLQGGVFAR